LNQFNYTVILSSESRCGLLGLQLRRNEVERFALQQLNVVAKMAEQPMELLLGM